MQISGHRPPECGRAGLGQASGVDGKEGAGAGPGHGEEEEGSHAAAVFGLPDHRQRAAACPVRACAAEPAEQALALATTGLPSPVHLSSPSPSLRRLFSPPSLCLAHS